uniref:Auxin responsive protein n=1 Tax=Oryza meridionalis TaxID=40149 RepID=A0A0E0D484_9ORYZ
MVYWRSKSGGGGASPRRDNGGEDDQVPRGHVPMVAGDGGERVMVPVRLLGDPCIAELLAMAAQQYGYGQPGVLRVPCDAGHFRRVVECALRKDGGRAKLGDKTLICTRLPTTLEEDLAFCYTDPQFHIKNKNKNIKNETRTQSLLHQRSDPSVASITAPPVHHFSPR